MRLTGAVAAIAVAVSLTGTEPARAKSCGSVVLRPGLGWIVGGAGVSCKKMRRWSRSMLSGHRGPRGWHCVKRGHGRRRSGGCSKGPNGTAPFFIYYPPG
jgi:hypothetical protein